MGQIVKKNVRVGQKPNKEQLSEVKKASLNDIVFDEESPEISYEEMLEMVKAAKKRKGEQKKEIVTLRLSTSALRKAKATGKGYTGFLGRLVENALNDKDLVARSL